MILHEVKTYIAVCGWCRKESEPFTHRDNGNVPLPPGWYVMKQESRTKWGRWTDSKYCCPTCMTKADDDDWVVREYRLN